VSKLNPVKAQCNWDLKAEKDGIKDYVSQIPAKIVRGTSLWLTSQFELILLKRDKKIKFHLVLYFIRTLSKKKKALQIFVKP
jgi:hypothetical protein